MCLLLENCAEYGLDLEPEPEPEQEPSRNQNRNKSLPLRFHILNTALKRIFLWQNPDDYWTQENYPLENVLYDTLDEEKVEIPTEDVGIFQRMKNFFTGSSGTSSTSDSFFQSMSFNEYL